MSTLARRTLRTTAAAAGMAALGVGLAGNALAAPEVPGPLEPAAGPALPALPALSDANPLAELPGTPDAPKLPMLFVFEGPTINTAGPSDTAPAPVRGTTPQAAVQQDAADDTSGSRYDRGDDAGYDGGYDGDDTGVDQIGALSALDAAGLFADPSVQPNVEQPSFGFSGLGLR